MTCDDARKRTDPQAMAHMRECESCLDAVVSRVLETPPEVVIPPGFAVHAAQALPPPAAEHHWGLPAAIALLIILGAAAVALTGPQWMALHLRSELLVVLTALIGIELAAVALWLGRTSRV